MAQRLQVVFVIRAAVSFGTDMINVSGGSDQADTLALNAQWVSGQVHLAELAPTVVIATGRSRATAVIVVATAAQWAALGADA